MIGNKNPTAELVVAPKIVIATPISGITIAKQYEIKVNTKVQTIF